MLNVPEPRDTGLLPCTDQASFRLLRVRLVKMFSFSVLVKSEKRGSGQSFSWMARAQPDNQENSGWFSSQCMQEICRLHVSRNMMSAQRFSIVKCINSHGQDDPNPRIRLLDIDRLFRITGSAVDASRND